MPGHSPRRRNQMPAFESHCTQRLSRDLHNCQGTLKRSGARTSFVASIDGNRARAWAEDARPAY
jgi:hypothetical protein